MQEELLDVLRNPFYLISITFILSICLVNGSQQLGEAVEIELQAYRLQQYELNGNAIGSKNAKVHYEAVSLHSKALRRCVIASWKDIATRDIDSLMSSSVGALLIIIPSQIDSLSDSDKTLFLALERNLAIRSTDLAVYVVPSSVEALSILSDVSSSSTESSTAVQQLINNIAANTFQFTSVATPPTGALTYKPDNIVAQLVSNERSAPTIAFVAHYDSHAVFPGIATGSDSNGSGVVMLLELLSIFRHFYDNPVTRPPYNLVFIWSAGGKYNYQGARHWIEEFTSSAADQRLEMAICIDSVGGDGPLYMHASKQPTEGSAAAKLFNRLQTASPKQTLKLVTKKISVNAPLSWEHERFNMKRLPAITLSRLATPEDPLRKSLLDTPSQISADALEHNIRMVAEAVLGHVLSLPEDGFSSDPRVSADSSLLSRDAVDRLRLSHYIRQFATKPRPLSDQIATQTISSNIAVAAANYAKVTRNEVTLQDVSVWGGTADRLLAEKVKPAVFELVISAGVFVYLAVFYHLIANSQKVLETTVQKLKIH